MHVKQHTLRLAFRLLVVSLCVAFPVGLMAQVNRQTTESRGASTRQATVERGEVVFLSGNSLVVKMENGEIRHFTVPDNATAVVDGKTIAIRDAKPGMKLERTITTTTTPKVITEVRRVTGTVWNVMPPNSVILTMENGQNQQFKIPKGQKFMVDGQEVSAFHLKKGMKISATKIIETPVTVAERQRKVTGTMPTPPPPPPADVPMIIEEPVQAAAAAQAPEPAPEPAPAAMPKTASPVPLIGLLGLLSLGLGVGLRAVRNLA